MALIKVQPSVISQLRDGRYADQIQPALATLIIKDSSYPDNQRHFLLSFDLSQLTSILKAELRLKLVKQGDSQSRNVSVVRSTREFNSAATWNQYKMGVRWSTPGGDFAERLSTIAVSQSKIGQELSWDVTAFTQSLMAGDKQLRVGLLDVSSGSAKGIEFDTASSRLEITVLDTSGDVPDSPSGAPLKVVQWNIHKGVGLDGKTDDGRVADILAALKADVYALNEVHFFRAEHYNVNEGQLLANLLEQRTGELWNMRFVNATNYRERSGVGAVFLSRLPINDWMTTDLPYNRAALAISITVGGQRVRMFAAHVDYYDAAARTAQTKKVRDWSQSFLEPRIVCGDFNTTPGTGDYKILADVYRDSWLEAQKAGVAVSAYNTSGSTRGASRFDYVYLDRNISIEGVQVPRHSVNGVEISDHHPVVAQLRIL